MFISKGNENLTNNKSGTDLNDPAWPCIDRDKGCMFLHGSVSNYMRKRIGIQSKNLLFSSALSRMAMVSSLKETVCSLRISVRMPVKRGEQIRRPSYEYTYTLVLSTNRKCLFQKSKEDHFKWDLCTEIDTFCDSLWS